LQATQGVQAEVHASVMRLVIGALFVAGFLFSYWYLEAYYRGDQTFYRNFYDSLFGTATQFWRGLQETYTGSSEPLYRYLIGAGAFYDIDRLLYLSFWNALLIASIGHVLAKSRSSVLFSVLLFTNYYLLVLLGPAERLKFAYICLVIGFASKNVAVRMAVSVMSFFFHTQALVQFASAAGYFLAKNYRDLLSSPLRLLLFVVTGSIGLVGVFFVFYELLGTSISLKIEVYSSASEGYFEALQWSLILVGGLVVFSDRLAYFVGMLPMGVLTILFGNRVNVATLVFFVGTAIAQRKTSHPLVLVVMAYMSLKSIPFMINVLTYGTGYLDG
jgi:hypothetical protein